MTRHDTTTLTDDDLLPEVRTECAGWEARDELDAGFARLFVFRDEPLRRGLPLPMAGPMEVPPTLIDVAKSAVGAATDGVPI